MPPAVIWQAPPGYLALPVGALHLWRISLSGADLEPDAYWPLLNAEQRSRTQALRDPRLRARYARGRAGLNLILARYLQRPPAQIETQRTPNGKPKLCGADAWLRFSFTHSDGIALVALSCGPQAELGVDCERIRPRPHLLAIARRLFDPETCAELESAPPNERLERFYWAWTALEARVKWDGRGLFAPPLPQMPPPQIVHVVPAAGYCAAIARSRLPPLADWSVFALDRLDPSAHA
ncbi:4'-phosphopantetheinyl transferase superfamily protein [Caldichromatium japonicum]|uniref:4'-phosphopantetheinyl transferase superfamily protein n=1 Tax=Caldichromatium japonicum TaxID=2699430 RepID=A0A6G7VE54_9GAMM|nr:4'-phosphopantetheinyl transferase superfamily protein [Caldichromatium japonicum]QIK38146.1 4'-phosphopantetheinyl transferase superfamily protein [Caldichromatium japonicum]